MCKHLNPFIIATLFLLLPNCESATLPHNRIQTTETLSAAKQLDGQWRVKFTIASVEKNLIFDAIGNGLGSFHLLDTAPDAKPVIEPLRASWAQLTNDRVSISGEVELPIGTCCREMGTLIFKGRFTSADSISGKLIFVTSVDEEESPYKFHSDVGTFTAVRAVGKLKVQPAQPAAE